MGVIKTPQEIKQLLDEYVIGHEQSKKYLSVAAYNHYKRMRGDNIKKTNVMIIGPTGCGKTYLVSCLSDILQVPFITIDSTQLTASGYEGRSVEDIMTELVNACDGDETLAEYSIIYLDEIDKIKKKNTENDVNGLGVQQALLKLVEGSDVVYTSESGNSQGKKHDSKINTKNMLFICSGAFVDLSNIETTSLIKYGMIPEFLGRFSIITKLNELTISNFKQILKDSKGSILNSFREWFSTEGIELIVTEDAINILANNAMAKGLGARGLQGSLEEVLIDAQFQAPSLTTKPRQFILDAHVMITKKPKWVY
jgi:ATP-dependent Clp protease ATP-binding subunit ClpX